MVVYLNIRVEGCAERKVSGQFRPNSTEKSHEKAWDIMNGTPENGLGTKKPPIVK